MGHYPGPGFKGSQRITPRGGDGDWPPGVLDTRGEHPWPRGLAIGLGIKDHPARVATFLDELATGQLSDDAQGFFSNIASFWENLPPSGKDASTSVDMT